jgi:hypothetical protein
MVELVFFISLGITYRVSACKNDFSTLFLLL